MTCCAARPRSAGPHPHGRLTPTTPTIQHPSPAAPNCPRPQGSPRGAAGAAHLCSPHHRVLPLAERLLQVVPARASSEPAKTTNSRADAAHSDEVEPAPHQLIGPRSIRQRGRTGPLCRLYLRHGFQPQHPFENGASRARKARGDGVRAGAAPAPGRALHHRPTHPRARAQDGRLAAANEAAQSQAARLEEVEDMVGALIGGLKVRVSAALRHLPRLRRLRRRRSWRSSWRAGARAARRATGPSRPS